jgi:hypothetical protein
MKILSFDVGIRNLAYCIINKTDIGFTIEDWGLINLDDERKLCDKLLKNNKVCGKTAVCIANKLNDPEYLCKAHKLTHKYKVAIKTTDIKTHKCMYEFKSNKLCNKEACNIINNPLSNEINTEYYCVSHISKKVKELESELGPKKIPSQNCNKIPLTILSIKLTKCLNTHINFTKVDEVYIENQPSLKNPTMKTISTFLYQYFTIRSIIDQNNTIKTIRFIAPSSKLKVNKKNTDKLLNNETTERGVYNMTKELGEEYCKAILKNDKNNIHTEKLEYLNKQPKQDDLCDAFLQGYYQLYCQTGIPENIVKIFDEVNKLCESRIKTINDKKIKLKNKKKSQINEQIEKPVEKPKTNNKIKSKIKIIKTTDTSGIIINID